MEIVVQITFGLITALIIGAAMMVVTVRNVIHAALWLIASFFGVAALYMLLEAEFIAVVQVLVYVGAISILILFAIMLTRQVTGEGVRQLTNRWWLSALVSAALFAAVIVPTVINHQWNAPVPPAATAGVAPQPEVLAGPAELGRGFVFEYLIQFQVAGVLLTVALIGAIVIAFEERARRRRVLTLAEEHELRKSAGGRRKPAAEEAAGD
jgi:NADH-quinone oxidoreductase subunit J